MYLETKIVPSSETRKFSPFKKTQIAHQAAEREEEAVDDSQQPTAKATNPRNIPHNSAFENNTENNNNPPPLAL